MARVCVIEDDAGIRETVRSVLEDAGYEVMEAADGKEGYGLLQTSSERLVVLLDNKMPHLRGCDVLELVAQTDGLAERHAYVYMTAAGADQLTDHCQCLVDTLADGIVAKPFDIDVLLAAVARAERHLA